MVSASDIASNRRSGVSLDIVDASIDDAVESRRMQLLEEAGLLDKRPDHYKRPTERRFNKEGRRHTTIWFGGLTMRHEQLILAGLEGLGYKVGIIPTPIKADFQAGKEYGNNGQCNPTYFTVGALVNHLKRLRDEEGLPLETILEDNVFITAGACGPCRFGMYEAEYRLALRNSGFDGFRVLLFQQGGGLDQAAMEAGIEFNLNFFLSLINAMFMGDILNEVAYQIRPYEVVPGKTDEVMARCMAICQEALREKNYDEIHGGAIAGILSRFAPVNSPDDAEKFLDQLRGTYFADVFAQCRAIIDEEIEVDFLRPKPVVKITGEFWAQTTEGDGNFRMFPFLEEQGAEVLVEPVATWIAYMLHQAEKMARSRKGLNGDKGADPRGNDGSARRGLLSRLGDEFAFHKKLFTFRLTDKIITREYNRLRKAIGDTTHELVNQLELTRLGHPYYDSRAGGGEGHLEVAKNIYYANKDLAHMVLSLKPFGCMPSTQSDGAQAAVVSHYKDIIYLPIETSGEGDVNAHSRVQMALGEAKNKSKEEFKNVLAKTGRTLDELRAFVNRPENRDLRRPLQHTPHRKGVIGKAANFAMEVATRLEGGPRLGA